MATCKCGMWFVPRVIDAHGHCSTLCSECEPEHSIAVTTTSWGQGWVMVEATTGKEIGRGFNPVKRPWWKRWFR